MTENDDRKGTKKLASFERIMGISQTYAASVGYFLTAFSNMEEHTNQAIWAILGLSGSTGGHEITTSIRDFGQRMLLLAKLGKARLRAPKNRTDCANLIRAIQFLNDRRVDLVHSAPAAWMPDAEGVVVVRVTSERARVRHVPTAFSTSYLCELTEYALLAYDAIIKFRKNVERGSDLTLPSLDTRPEPLARVT